MFANVIALLVLLYKNARRPSYGERRDRFF
jgi:hypothetical protein